MITKISLNGFQCHKKTEIPFKEGVNVITGPSDTGKSSIVRAFRLVVFNRPSGSSFITTGSDSMSVELAVRDTGLHGEVDVRSVERKKEKGFNGYVIGENEYAALRTDVPEEVFRVLGISEINLQTQHASFFMLQNTPSEVAKALNEISGLEIIDESLSRINSIVKRIGGNLYETRTQNDKLTSELSALSWVDKAKEKLAVCEKQEACVGSWDTYTSTLRSLLSVYRENSNESEDGRLFTDYVDDSNVFLLWPDLKKEKVLYGVLNTLISDYNACEVLTTQLSFEQVGKDLSDGKKWLDEVIAQEKMASALEQAIDDYQQAEKQAQLREVAAKELKEQLHQIEEEIGLCPLCERPFGGPL